VHNGTFVTVLVHTALPQCVGRANNTECSLCSVSGCSCCIASGGIYCDSSCVLGHDKVWVRNSVRFRPALWQANIPIHWLQK